jgi:hypothetical protein
MRLGGPARWHGLKWTGPVDQTRERQQRAWSRRATGETHPDEYHVAGTERPRRVAADADAAPTTPGHVDEDRRPPAAGIGNPSRIGGFGVDVGVAGGAHRDIVFG